MWRENELLFAERFKHSAWGINHYNRVYEMSINLAKCENRIIDEEAIFAAAYLHDMGAFEPYKDPKEDHAERSAKLCEGILLQIKFPESKIPLVKEIIEHHMFYANPGSSFESIVFRDADILDFMGVIGITRILSITGSDNWTPDLKSAIDLIKKFSTELQGMLITSEAKKIGAIRKVEMDEYLKVLSGYTKEFKCL